jgi:hypothetical protein
MISTMAKKAKADSEGGKKVTGLKPYTVRLRGDIAARVDDVAEALGLDPTSFIRQLVHTHLREEEKRAKELVSGPENGA